LLTVQFDGASPAMVHAVNASSVACCKACAIAWVT